MKAIAGRLERAERADRQGRAAQGLQVDARREVANRICAKPARRSDDLRQVSLIAASRKPRRRDTPQAPERRRCIDDRDYRTGLAGVPAASSANGSTAIPDRLMVLPAVHHPARLRDLPARSFPPICRCRASRCAAGGFKLTFVGLVNFKRLIFGAQQYHFLGTFKPLRRRLMRRCAGHRARGRRSMWLVRYAARLRRARASIGRLIAATVAFGIALLSPCHDRCAGRRPGHAPRHAPLRRRRRRGAVRARPRPRASLRPADPRPRLLPGALLHSADGDAGRRRLHVPHAGRHAEGPVRAARCAASASRRMVLGDRGLVGAADGADRRHLAMDAVHVHRAARRDREPAARSARGGPARRRRAASRSSATSPGRRSRRSPRRSCSSA